MHHKRWNVEVCPSDMDSDWSEKEFRKRNVMNVKRESTFFAEKSSFWKSQRTVVAHICDVSHSKFFSFC